MGKEACILPYHQNIAPPYLRGGTRAYPDPVAGLEQGGHAPAHYYQHDLVALA